MTGQRKRATGEAQHVAGFSDQSVAEDKKIKAVIACREQEEAVAGAWRATEDICADLSSLSQLLVKLCTCLAVAHSPPAHAQRLPN